VIHQLRSFTVFPVADFSSFFRIEYVLLLFEPLSYSIRG